MTSTRNNILNYLSDEQFKAQNAGDMVRSRALIDAFRVVERPQFIEQYKEQAKRLSVWIGLCQEDGQPLMSS